MLSCRQVHRLLNVYCKAGTLPSVLSSCSLNPQSPLKVEIIPILQTQELRPKEIKNVFKVRWPVCDTMKPMFFLPYKWIFKRLEGTNLDMLLGAMELSMGYMFFTSLYTGRCSTTIILLTMIGPELSLKNVLTTWPQEKPSCLPLHSSLRFSHNQPLPGPWSQGTAGPCCSTREVFDTKEKSYVCLRVLLFLGDLGKL